jgi:hypothetical protein
MSNATFGELAKILGLPSEQPAIRTLFRDVLGGVQTHEIENWDIFRFGRNFYLGMVYSTDALALTIMEKAIWLELKAPDPAAMKVRILAAGARVIEFGTRGISTSRPQGSGVPADLGQRRHVGMEPLAPARQRLEREQRREPGILTSQVACRAEQKALNTENQYGRVCICLPGA